MLVDGTGSARLGRKFLRELRAAGVEFAWFNPMRAESRAIVASEIACQGFGQRLGQSAARLLSPLL